MSETPTSISAVQEPARHRPLALSATGGPGHNEFWTLLRPGKSLTDFRSALFQRDFHTCQFCGFWSRKYQELVAFRGIDWDLSQVATGCIFCVQCLRLESVSSMRSGVLLWLPERAQTEIHTVMRLVYICRISQGPPAEKARKLLDLLMARRPDAKKRIGTDDPAVLAEEMNACSTTEALCALRRKLTGIRLLPLDRRIIREADLEFNQFPQILAYWRSKDGPFGGKKPHERDLSSIERLIQELI